MSHFKSMMIKLNLTMEKYYKNTFRSNVLVVLLFLFYFTKGKFKVLFDTRSNFLVNEYSLVNKKRIVKKERIFAYQI